MGSKDRVVEWYVVGSKDRVSWRGNLSYSGPGGSRQLREKKKNRVSWRGNLSSGLTRAARPTEKVLFVNYFFHRSNPLVSLQVLF